MTVDRPLPQRFYSLDVLRGVTAIAVIIYHWQLFFYGQPAPCDLARLPFHSVLWPIYTQGFRSVEVFFTLSGFIFCWLYAKQIADRTIRAREFFVLRFSRLYPLHFATLVFVALVQWIAQSWHGSFILCIVADLYHFVLQLFFASSWGFEKDLSFNGPVWSVSVEVLLYLLFFILCSRRLARWWVFAICVLLGYFMINSQYPLLGRGLLSFFVGGLSFMLFSYVHKRRLAHRYFLIASGVLVTGGIAEFLLCYCDAYRVYREILGTRCVIFGHDVVGATLLRLHGVSFHIPMVLVVFPILIVSLALIETSRGSLGKRMAFLGDMSYSMYLLHLPLQMIVVSAALYFRMDWSFFYSPGSLLLFFAVLFPLSWLSYRRFEKPAQLYLRKRLESAKADRTIAAPIRS